MKYAIKIGPNAKTGAGNPTGFVGKYWHKNADDPVDFNSPDLLIVNDLDGNYHLDVNTLVEVLQLEVGKTYRTRGGKTVKIIGKNTTNGVVSKKWPWFGNIVGETTELTFSDRGSWAQDFQESRNDLVSEVGDALSQFFHLGQYGEGDLVPEPRDKTGAERKAEPVHSGVLMYFPDALAAVSRVSKAGNDKHNPGEPLHWARGKSMDQLDCVTRHSLTPERIDPETGEVEAAAMVWRGLAELQLIEEKRLRAAGIKSYSGL